MSEPKTLEEQRNDLIESMRKTTVEQDATIEKLRAENAAFRKTQAEAHPAPAAPEARTAADVAADQAPAPLRPCPGDPISFVNASLADQARWKQENPHVFEQLMAQNRRVFVSDGPVHVPGEYSIPRVAAPTAATIKRNVPSASGTRR